MKCKYAKNECYDPRTRYDFACCMRLNQGLLTDYPSHCTYDKISGTD